MVPRDAVRLEGRVCGGAVMQGDPPDHAPGVSPEHRLSAAAATCAFAVMYTRTVGTGLRAAAEARRRGARH